MKGDVVWSYYDETNLSIGEKVYIFYDMNSFKLCEEPFPITIPDYRGCVNTFDNLDKFRELGEGDVSNDETCGDIVNREKDDKLFVVYSKEDIISWTEKLNDLNIKL